MIKNVIHGIEINKIHCGDAVEVLTRIHSECIDMCLTSPPYDNIYTYHNYLSTDISKFNGYSFDFENIAKELYRIIKPGGVVVWVVGDAVIDGGESGSSFRQALYFKEIGFKLYDTMIYEKNSIGFPSKYRYQNIFEYMFVLSKGKPSTINLLKDKKNKWAGVTNWGDFTGRDKDGNRKVIHEPVTIGEYGIRNNIWRYNVGGKGQSSKDDIAFEHPAIFPEALAKDHILSWSNKGDVVLDPFMGSGTTAKMAMQYDRKFIGIEINQDYIKIANERIHNYLNGLGNYL